MSGERAMKDVLTSKTIQATHKFGLKQFENKGKGESKTEPAEPAGGGYGCQRTSEAPRSPQGPDLLPACIESP